MNQTTYRLDRVRGHKLLTKVLRRRLPPLYATDGQGEKALAIVKYFTPDSSWYWYGVEFDGDDLFFGLVIGHEAEMGYFRLSELAELTGQWGLPVERDKWFQPTPLREVRKYHHCQETRF